LERRLNDRLIDRMQHEHDLQQRALIYSFPQQFAALKALLIGFLSSVFTASRFHETAMLRGVYFTSGTQEGSPIDRVMGTLARSLGMENKILPPQVASGRSYFLTRLLKEVIFAEQGLAGTNLKWERRRALLRLGGLALIGIVTVGGVLAWYMSYRSNTAYVAAVDAKLAVVKSQVESVPTGTTTNVVTLLPVLQSVQDLSATAGVDGGRAPLMMSFGLSQGDKLSSASTNAYRRLLRDTFMQRVVYRVEEQLRSDGSDNVELLYENLKAYLMFFDAEHFDAAAVKAWIITDWEQTLPREVSVDQRKALEGHLDALFANGQVTPPLPADERLVQQVRAQLAALPLAQRIYSRLKRQGVGSDIPEFKISQAAGPAAALVFERSSGQPLTKGMPGLFTYDGYHTAFLREADRVTKQLADEEGWVLGVADRQKSRFGDAAAVENLTDEVRGLYLQDYANIWQKFIDDIKLVRSDSLQKSIELARILSSSSSSPLPLLMRALVKETTLSEAAAEDKTLVGKASETVKQSRESLLRIIGGGRQAQSRAAPGKTLESIVDDRFDDLRRMVRAPAGQTPPIEASLALINELYTLLTATDTAVKGGAAPPQSDVPTKIKAEAARMPEPLRSMLQTLSTSGSSQALGAMRSNLSASLTAAVGDFCPKAINGRYPFVRGSPRDVTQEDFGRLFAPGGLIDDFFQKNLQPYVDTSTKPWSFKRIGDASLGNSATLAQFQHAAAIRDVFFRGGGRTVSMRLDFKAMEMDASINQFILDVDGQLVKYSHGPQVPQAVQWPGPKGSTQVRVQIQPPSAAGVSGSVFEGPWALFRMFDRLQIEKSPQTEKFRVTFNIEGRRAVFEVTTSSVQNPFRLQEFEQFQCPNKL
jgi:type VI secretion system protein ImpL